MVCQVRRYKRQRRTSALILARASLLTAGRNEVNFFPFLPRVYTKAVEQLGSNKAPVRFDGWYALERLAQDHPAHRQTIVNVIAPTCAWRSRPRRQPASRSPPEGQRAWH